MVREDGWQQLKNPHAHEIQQDREEAQEAEECYNTQSNWRKIVKAPGADLGVVIHTVAAKK